jgi:Tol biopolymer transport system component
VAPHGDRIAFAVRIEDPNIWRLDLDSHGLAGSGPATPVAQSTATDANPALSPDGALLAFRSGRTGISEIWLSDALGKSARRLTECNGGWCGNPDWSPDGRLLAYEATRNGSPQIYIISRDGGAAKRLSSTQETTNETMPHWSRDGHSIYCASNASGEYQIWKRHLEGGPPEQITRSGGYSAQESFDGHSIFFTKSEAKSGLWRQSLAGGPEELVASQLPANMWGNWRVTKNGVYFISFVWEERPFTQTLYFYDSATGQVRVAARVPGIAMPFSAGLAVSADERSVYFVQVDRWGVGIYFAEDIKW